jgi:pimeloyl-ACP methyl ester carboxylesterase
MSNTERQSDQPSHEHRSLMRLGLAIAGLLIAVVVVAGCGDDDSGDAVDSDPAGVPTTTVELSVCEPPEPAPSTTTATAWGTVVTGVVYRDPAATDSACEASTVDVFVPDTFTGRPAVVLLHGIDRNGDGVEGTPLDAFGEEIARLGATVFRFGWQTSDGWSSLSADDLSCMGPFVQARAVEYGADPDKVVIVGFSMGGEAASKRLSHGCRAPVWSVTVSMDRATGGRDQPTRGRADRVQAMRQSLRRLWVAQMSFHSLSTAARPRWATVRIPRLCLICAKTGSIEAARFL